MHRGLTSCQASVIKHITFPYFKMGSSSESASVDIVHIHSVSPEIPGQGLGGFKACLALK